MCISNYRVGLDIYILLFVLCFGKSGLWRARAYAQARANALALGHVAKSVKCLATELFLTADPGVASSIPARSNTFVKIDYEIISWVILLPSAESFKKGCYQLQAKVCAQSTG